MIAQEKPIGPTPETKRHGDYVRPEGKGTLAVYTNRHPNLLGKLKGHGAITPRQWAAGVAFEGTWCHVNGSASPSRDSTIPPLGGVVHETEAQAERFAKSRARLHTILNRIGPGRYSILVSVVCFGEGIGQNRGAGKGKALILRGLLCESLDQCAIVYGIDKEAA
jgi:hypothetical protein